MARTIRVSLPGELTHQVSQELRQLDGVVGLSVQRGASIKPQGDVLTIDVTNSALDDAMEVLSRLHVGRQGSIGTAEPLSLVSSSDQDQIDYETNESTWPEMACHFRRNSNITGNYVMAMFFAGVIAAVGLWTDTVHIVVGAMVVAPGFEPILRTPFGLMAREPEAWKQGLASTAVGYLAMIAGAAVCLMAMTLLDPSQQPLADRYWVGYWSKVTASSVLVALVAGAAGAAIIAAQRSVLTAGVMIALALVPSASIVGMGVATLDFELAGEGLGRWLVETACVVIGGGAVFRVKQMGLHRRRKRNSAGGGLYIGPESRKAEGPG